MAKYKVVVTDPGYKSYESERRICAAAGAELAGPVVWKDPCDLMPGCQGAHGLLVRQAPIDRALIEALPDLKVIARYGIGVDNVDLEAATARGVVVANVLGYCVEEVSDQALALILACARKLVDHDKRVRAGEWDIGPKDPVFRITGKTFGLIGYGSIPRRLHEKLAGWRFRMLVHDPYVKPEAAKAAGVELVSLETLLKQSDYVSVHAPSNKETFHMIGERQLAMMKPTAVLVNTARGPVIDEAALARALAKGRPASAGLDVYEKEPLPADSALRKLPNVVLTDHAGWYSEESIQELQEETAKAAAAVLKGERPRSCVNPKVYEKLGK
jgi:D-3-phosphoglycerate dehydrogenase